MIYHKMGFAKELKSGPGGQLREEKSEAHYTKEWPKGILIIYHMMSVGKRKRVLSGAWKIGGRENYKYIKRAYSIATCYRILKQSLKNARDLRL